MPNEKTSAQQHEQTLDPETAQQLRITGTKVNYWVVCQRRLWLFAHHIALEQTSDRVALGRLLHETSYRRQGRREILLHELICIDLLEHQQKLIEIKYSPKLLEAARLQLAYYLWYLKQLGTGDLTGEIRLPRQRYTETVRLDTALEHQVQQALAEIPRIEKQPRPPNAEWQSICRLCAYCELCWG